MNEVMRENQLRTFCMQTMTNWMHALDFKYDCRRKTYYVDGHEDPDVVQYRKEYVTKYMKDELCCFRWIQLKESEVERMERV